MPVALGTSAAAAARRLAVTDGVSYLGHRWRPLSHSRGAHLQVRLLQVGRPEVSAAAGLPRALVGADMVLRRRRFHLTSRLLSSEPPSSKIEETVERLKRKQKEKEEQLLENLDDYTRMKSLQSKVASVIEQDKEEARLRAEKEERAVDVPKKSLWVRFTDEVKHYYSGFKLLYLDVRICSKIIWKVCRGNTLTRRENKQLVRTVSDLFRLVPFSVFVIVPFMEFLLPVALKLFPGMLPSTFTTSSERENKMRRTLKAKLHYAKFLQQTLDEMAPKSSNTRSSQSARDFVEFFNKVKEEGLAASNKEIVKFSQLFEDEITLDNMARSQLIALCRLLEISPIGTSNFLRFQLEMRVRQLKIDDRVIMKEGTDNLDVIELQAACKERGMRAYGLTEQALKHQLDQWLDLSLNHSIPPSLLLLSRTLFLPESVDVTRQIAATISALPESAATQTSAQIGQREGKVRNVMQLEVIREEQRKIEEEEKERLEAVKLEAAAQAAAAAAAAEEPPITEETAKEVAAKEQKEEIPPAVTEAVKEDVQELKKLVQEARGQVTKVTVSSTGDLQEKELLVDKAPTIKDEVEVLQEEDQVAETAEAAEKKQETPEISSDDLTIIKSAIDSLHKAEVADKEDIVELKKELQDYEEDLEDLKWIKAEAGRFDLQESKGAKLLFSRVNRMLGKVDGLADSLQEKEKAIAAKLKDAETSEEEKAKVEENLVTVHELLAAVTKLQGTSDSAKVEHIAAVSHRIRRKVMVSLFFYVVFLLIRFLAAWTPTLTA